jgi:hypothetical protein
MEQPQLPKILVYFKNMSEFLIKKLILASPLMYTKDNFLRFPVCGTVRGEVLFRMALDPSRSRGIEPDRRFFPGSPAAGGTAGDGDGTPAIEAPDRLELPAGTYIFTQVQELADRETLIDMIIETQREALWERLSPDDHFYIRYLVEDGRTVTQVFRPVE